VIPVRVLATLFLASFTVAPLARSAINPETGSWVFQRYSPDQYGASPENWAIAQDSHGVMYFANTDALLEFDGQSWRSIRLPNRSVVRSVAVDDRDVVYVGGVGIFGMLRPDRKGTEQFVSLLDKVPQADRKFADVWRVLTTPQGIYFSSYERLFRLGPSGAIRVWRPVSNFGRALVLRDRLYVKTREKGLLRMDGDSLTPVRGGEVFRKLGVTAGASTNYGGLIASPSGLFRLDSAGVTPFPTSADSFFADNLLYTIHVFADGEIAAGTRKGGLALLTGAGVLDRVLTKAGGLADNYVIDIFQDRQGGVWLTGYNGITWLNPGLTRFDADLGRQGDTKCVVRAGGLIYAGGTAGLFVMRSGQGMEPRFERIPGIDTTVSEILPYGAGVLAASDIGVFAASPGGAKALLKFSNSLFLNDIAPSLRDPSVIYLAGRGGVFALREQNGVWKKIGEFSTQGQEFRSVREDPDGTLWASTGEGIWHIDLRAEPARGEDFTEDAGVPPGFKTPRLFHGRMVFATPRGMRRYDAATRHFEPDNEFGPSFADGSRDVFNLQEDVSGNVWITGEHYHDILNRNSNGGFTQFSAPLLASGIQGIYAMAFDNDGVIWASGAKGVLHRWERALYGNPDSGFQVLARRVATTADNVTLFGGAGGFSSARLPYRQNSLRFEFAAPFSEDNFAVEYQVLLEGSDSGWSPWSRESRKEYTHLAEGSYRLRVRARSPHGAVAENAAVAFTFLPPWYRTWWAYGTYLIFAGFGVWGIVGWRTYQLVEKNKRLEKIVEERTVEIREQRDEIHRQERKGHALLLNILPEAVADELKSSGSVRPVGFNDVTVCFTDFVGFTLSSEKLAPDALVDKLNLYFTAFDEIVTSYGLEKLKTIGDAYMFASGLPARRSAHAVDAVLAALEMVDVVKRLAPVTGWNIRIGLNSGPVIAGVVGIRKFAFDIWGNTVNLASRMESSGVPGRVNLSERTYQLTHGLFNCEARGQIHTKDGRDLPMYLVEGVAADPATFTTRYEAAFGEQPRQIPAVESETRRAVTAS